MLEDVFTLLKKIDTVVTDVENGNFERFSQYRILAREWESLIAKYYGTLPEYLKDCYTVMEYEQSFQKVYKFAKYAKEAEYDEK